MPLIRPNVAPAAAEAVAEAPAELPGEDDAVVNESAPASPAQVSTPPSAAVAVPRPQGSGLMPSGQGGDDGFGVLDSHLGFGSFPIVKLDKQEYEVENETLGQAFDCVMLKAQEKQLHRVSDSELLYTVDGVLDSKGRPVEQIHAEWRAKGLKWVVKTYIEILALMQGGPKDGELVILSIPPASNNRLGGYRASLQLMRGKRLSEVVTTCGLGPKLKVDGNTFYPWAFRYKEDYVS